VFNLSLFILAARASQRLLGIKLNWEKMAKHTVL